MLNNFKNIMIGILSAVVVLAVGASAYNAFASPDAATSVASDATPLTGSSAGADVQVTTIPVSELSADEAAALLFMREEEKLASDVYNQLFALWGLPTFQSIASSEQTHMDQIKLLMDRYALADPALDPGQFADANLQALYDQLIAQGSLSVVDAIKVGATIEEVDILDLQTRLTQTDNADIQLAYNSLMNGSFSHLQAFASVLTQQTGETYQPQYLSADQYQVIISSTNGNGDQGATGQGNGAQGSNTQGPTSAQTAGTGIPLANISGVTTVHGIVNSFDLTGINVTLDDGTALYVQLGNLRYNQSIGFAPAVGEGVTINGFPGNQGLYSAITVTIDSTAQTYTFRDSNGSPMWSGGNGQGGGNGTGSGNIP